MSQQTSVQNTSPGIAFVTIQTDSGTSPVATGPIDVLTFKSTDSSINITGDSSDDSINLTVNLGSVAGFTQNSIIFMGATDLDQDTSFVWLDITNRLGVNISAPLVSLDVGGSTRVKGTALSTLTGSIDPAASTAVVGVGTAFTTELVVGDRIVVTGETKTVITITDDTNLVVDSAFSDNADDTSPDRLSSIFSLLDSSGNVDFIVSDQGFVGIGTTSPAKNLHVQNASSGGSPQSNAFLVVEGSAGTHINLLAGNTSQSALFFGDDADNDVGGVRYDHNDNSMHFKVNASEKMRIDSAGNVGINETSPADKLDVNGGILSNGLTTDGICNFRRAGNTAAFVDRQTNDGPILKWRQGGTDEGTVSVSGNTITYGAFTGAHYGYSKEVFERGAVIVLTGGVVRIEGSPEPHYVIEECSIRNDSRCLGSYISRMEPSHEKDRLCEDDSDRKGLEKDDKRYVDDECFELENPHLIPSVGNFEMWVVDTGKDLKAGDRLITSEIKGHAELDDNELDESNIIGTVTEIIKWDEVTENIGNKKHKKISILFDRFVIYRKK